MPFAKGGFYGNHAQTQTRVLLRLRASDGTSGLELVLALLTAVLCWAEQVWNMLTFYMKFFALELRLFSKLSAANLPWTGA